MIAATVSEWLQAWPLAFLVGVVVGLIISSRGYRLIRANGDKPPP